MIPNIENNPVKVYYIISKARSNTSSTLVKLTSIVMNNIQMILGIIAVIGILYVIAQIIKNPYNLPYIIAYGPPFLKKICIMRLFKSSTKDAKIRQIMIFSLSIATKIGDEKSKKLITDFELLQYRKKHCSIEGFQHKRMENLRNNRKKIPISIYPNKAFLKFQKV